MELSYKKYKPIRRRPTSSEVPKSYLSHCNLQYLARTFGDLGYVGMLAEQNY